MTLCTRGFFLSSGRERNSSRETLPDLSLSSFRNLEEEETIIVIKIADVNVWPHLFPRRRISSVSKFAGSKVDGPLPMAAAEGTRTLQQNYVESFTA